MAAAGALPHCKNWVRLANRFGSVAGFLASLLTLRDGGRPRERDANAGTPGHRAIPAFARTGSVAMGTRLRGWRRFQV
jgi:hypothetical protein